MEEECTLTLLSEDEYDLLCEEWSIYASESGIFREHSSDTALELLKHQYITNQVGEWEVE